MNLQWAGRCGAGAAGTVETHNSYHCRGTLENLTPATAQLIPQRIRERQNSHKADPNKREGVLPRFSN